MKTVELTNCATYTEADILQGNLQSQGIDAEVYDTGLAAVTLNAGFPVLVPEDQYERAKKILDKVNRGR